MQQRPNKPPGHGKRMNSKQAIDLHESGARTRLRYNPLVPSQYIGDGPWVRGKRGVLAVGRRGKVILRFLLNLF